MATLQFPSIRWRRTHSTNESVFLGQITTSVTEQQEIFAMAVFLVKQGNVNCNIQVKMHTIENLNVVYAESEILDTTEIAWMSSNINAYGFIAPKFIKYPIIRANQSYYISINFTNYAPDDSNFFSTVFDYPSPHNWTYLGSPHNISEYPKSIVPLVLRER